MVPRRCGISDTDEVSSASASGAAAADRLGAAKLGAADGFDAASFGAAGPVASAETSDRSSGTGNGSPPCSDATASGEALSRRERRFVGLETVNGRSSGRGDSVISVCAADDAPACVHRLAGWTMQTRA